MPDYCICVPARNEAARLPLLLEALADQTVKGRIAVSLCINNSDDGSADAAAAVAARHPGRLDLRIDSCRLAPEIAHAGTARGRAMDAGLAWLGARGALISTDADCRPPPGWIEANLAAMAAGADLVGGRIVLDDAEPVDPAILALQARFDAYWDRVRRIEDSIDPSPHDPPPRHGDHTGASLAIDAALFAAIGGVPCLASGEDRAMVDRALATGARLVHPVTVWTRVSARVEGRAAGGMAVAMADRAACIALGRDPRVPSFDRWRERAQWRRRRREEKGLAAMLRDEAGLPPMPADLPLPALPS